MKIPSVSSCPVTKKRKPRPSVTPKDFAKSGTNQTLLEISDGDFLDGFAALLVDQVLAARQQEQPCSADNRFDSFSDS